MLDEAARNNDYDLYFLTYIDVPWEADDLRDRPDQREQMFKAFKKALDEHGKKYIILKGNKKERLKKAVKYVDELLKKKSQIS